MVNKDEAIKLVEKYLEYQNQRSNIPEFKTPIYTNILKKFGVFFLRRYYKYIKGDYLDFPEFYIKPDSWKKSKLKEIIFKDYVEDLEICWKIPYGAVQILEDPGNRFQSIGGGPIFVSKDDGLLYQTGSAPINWLESFKEFKTQSQTNNWPKWKPIDQEKYKL